MKLRGLVRYVHPDRTVDLAVQGRTLIRVPGFAGIRAGEQVWVENGRVTPLEPRRSVVHRATGRQVRVSDVGDPPPRIFPSYPTGHPIHVLSFCTVYAHFYSGSMLSSSNRGQNRVSEVFLYGGPKCWPVGFDSGWLNASTPFLASDTRPFASDFDYGDLYADYSCDSNQFDLNASPPPITVVTFDVYPEFSTAIKQKVNRLSILPPGPYALYGPFSFTTQDSLGATAVGQQMWGSLNPADDTLDTPFNVYNTDIGKVISGLTPKQQIDTDPAYSITMVKGHPVLNQTPGATTDELSSDHLPVHGIRIMNQIYTDWLSLAPLSTIEAGETIDADFIAAHCMVQEFVIDMNRLSERVPLGGAISYLVSNPGYFVSLENGPFCYRYANAVTTDTRWIRVKLAHSQYFQLSNETLNGSEVVTSAWYLPAYNRPKAVFDRHFYQGQALKTIQESQDGSTLFALFPFALSADNAALDAGDLFTSFGPPLTSSGDHRIRELGVIDHIQFPENSTGHRFGPFGRAVEELKYTQRFEAAQKPVAKSVLLSSVLETHTDDLELITNDLRPHVTLGYSNEVDNGWNFQTDELCPKASYVLNRAPAETPDTFAELEPYCHHLTFYVHYWRCYSTTNFLSPTPAQLLPDGELPYQSWESLYVGAFNVPTKFWVKIGSGPVLEIPRPTAHEYDPPVWELSYANEVTAQAPWLDNDLITTSFTEYGPLSTLTGVTRVPYVQTFSLWSSLFALPPGYWHLNARCTAINTGPDPDQYTFDYWWESTPYSPHGYESLYPTLPPEEQDFLENELRPVLEDQVYDGTPLYGARDFSSSIVCYKIPVEIWLPPVIDGAETVIDPGTTVGTEMRILPAACPEDPAQLYPYETGNITIEMGTGAIDSDSVYGPSWHGFRDWWDANSTVINKVFGTGASSYGLSKPTQVFPAGTNMNTQNVKNAGAGTKYGGGTLAKIFVRPLFPTLGLKV